MQYYIYERELVSSETDQPIVEFEIMFCDEPQEWECDYRLTAGPFETHEDAAMATIAIGGMDMLKIELTWIEPGIVFVSIYKRINAKCDELLFANEIPYIKLQSYIDAAYQEHCEI